MKNLKVLFTVLCVACATAVWSEEVTITFASGTNSNATYYFQNTSGSITNVLSFSTAKNSSSTTPAYNSSNSELRLYYHSGGAGGSITITAEDGVTITGFVLTTSTTPSTKYIAGDGSATDMSYTNKVATVNNLSCSSLKIQNCNKSNTQLRIKSIKVIYSSGSTETTYSVTFDAGTNGTCSTTLLTEKSQGSGVTLPNCNPNTDYTFVGWATTSSATSADAGKAGETYYPKENCTLYAVYSAVQNYTVTWVVGSNPSKTQSYTTQVASGRKATPPAELTLTGSEIGDCVDTFVGWSKSTLKSPTDTPPSDLFTDESPEAITANTTFYAVFAKKK